MQIFNLKFTYLFDHQLNICTRPISLRCLYLLKEGQKKLLLFFLRSGFHHLTQRRTPEMMTQQLLWIHKPNDNINKDLGLEVGVAICISSYAITGAIYPTNGIMKSKTVGHICFKSFLIWTQNE